VEHLAVVSKYTENETAVSEQRMYFSQDGGVKELLWTQKMDRWMETGRNLFGIDAGNIIAAGVDSVYWQQKATGEIREARINSDGVKWDIMAKNVA
jgi:hypothetical protein